MILRLLLDVLRHGPEPDCHRRLDLGNMPEHQFEARQRAFDLTATEVRQRFVVTRQVVLHPLSISGRSYWEREIGAPHMYSPHELGFSRLNIFRWNV